MQSTIDRPIGAGASGMEYPRLDRCFDGLVTGGVGPRQRVADAGQFAPTVPFEI